MKQEQTIIIAKSYCSLIVLTQIVIGEVVDE